MSLLIPEWTGLRDRTTRRHSYVLALFRFDIIKGCLFCFLLFGFVNVIIFVINPCDPYLRFVGAGSCVKVCFGSFGSIYTNLR